MNDLSGSVKSPVQRLKNNKPAAFLREKKLSRPGERLRRPGRVGPGRSGRIGPPRPRQPLRLDPPGALPARCSLTARKPLKYPITSAIGAQPGAARPHADTLRHICRHQHPMHLAHPGAATQAPGMCVSGREGLLLTFLLSKGLDGARVVNHLGGHSLPATSPPAAGR